MNEKYNNVTNQASPIHNRYIRLYVVYKKIAKVIQLFAVKKIIFLLIKRKVDHEQLRKK